MFDWLADLWDWFIGLFSSDDEVSEPDPKPIADGVVIPINQGETSIWQKNILGMCAQGMFKRRSQVADKFVWENEEGKRLLSRLPSGLLRGPAGTGSWDFHYNLNPPAGEEWKRIGYGYPPTDGQFDPHYEKHIVQHHIDCNIEMGGKFDEYIYCHNFKSDR